MWRAFAPLSQRPNAREKPTLLSQQPCLGGHQDWNCSAYIAMSRYGGVAGRICVPCSPVLFRHRADLAGGEPMLRHPWSATGSCGYNLLKLMQWLGAVPDGGATTAGVEPQAHFVRGCLVVCARICRPSLAPLLQATGDDLRVCATSLQRTVNCPIERSITVHCRQLLSEDEDHSTYASLRR